jgi:hypothetical protein
MTASQWLEEEWGRASFCELWRALL